MIKKLVVSGLMLALVVTLVPAKAGAVSNEVDELSDTLKEIKELQIKLGEQIVLARELRQGMSSEDVKALQEILAADPDVYPEGLVTGYYGALTSKAVAKFQKKHGLDAVGNVGPKTRAKINSLFGDDDFKCRAWGHMIVPGQMKKLGNKSVDLSKCAKVPPGIAKKIGDWTGTSTKKDTTDPKIENVDVNDINDESATIDWETNEKTTYVLWYGTDDDVDLDDADKESSNSLDTDHSVELEDLDDNTEYFFRIVAKDAAGNIATSSIRSFETDEN